MLGVAAAVDGKTRRREDHTQGFPRERALTVNQANTLAWGLQAVFRAQLGPTLTCTGVLNPMAVQNALLENIR